MFLVNISIVIKFSMVDKSMGDIFMYEIHTWKMYGFHESSLGIMGPIEGLPLKHLVLILLWTNFDLDFDLSPLFNQYGCVCPHRCCCRELHFLPATMPTRALCSRQWGCRVNIRQLQACFNQSGWKRSVPQKWGYPNGVHSQWSKNVSNFNKGVYFWFYIFYSWRCFFGTSFLSAQKGFYNGQVSHPIGSLVIWRNKFNSL